MIKILEKNIVVKDPKEELSVEIKNYLHQHLKSGDCLIKVPNDFPEGPNSKRHKKNYRVGFLFEMLSLIYADLGKEGKYYIIAGEYHFDFSYRQFKTILDEFEENKSKYLYKRNLLK